MGCNDGSALVISDGKVGGDGVGGIWCRVLIGRMRRYWFAMNKRSLVLTMEEMV